tara:strand:+ start:1389 stop:1736 length:348 start_codon:yes stop_codon:yes gene_type:complete
LNNKPFSRAERVSQQVLKTINEIISRDLDLRKYGFITFSSVKMTSDLKHANLYYSVINPKMNLEKINEEINNLVPVFRKNLSLSLNLRSTPTLKFFYDDSFEQFEKIDKLIKKID